MIDRRLRLVVTGLFLLCPAALAAQSPFMAQIPDTASTDTAAAATTSRRIPGRVVSGMPVDSVEGALLFENGIIGTADGLSFRGARPGTYSTWINGIDVTPSHRRVRLGLAPNTVASTSVITGPAPAWLGGSGLGALRMETRSGSVKENAAFGARNRGGQLSFETDRFTSGLGLNRIEAGIGTESRTSSIYLGGMLTGQKSAEFGMDAVEVPIFTAAGLDTTVQVPGLGDIAVPAWAAARGDCELFAGSADPGIAGNQDIECSDHRTPGSARSGYRLVAAADYVVGRTSKLGVLAIRGRDSDRIFDYGSLFNPANLFGRQAEAQVYALTLTGRLSARSGGSWRLSGSRQTDRLTVAPLTAEGEARTRDPAGGLMLGGFDFRWDRESFPIDSQLVANYRENVVGSRRSPYELENTSQYQTVDAFRDGPYALFGFTERGGPVGRLTIFEEKRTAGSASATWDVSRNSSFTLGGEYVKYSVSNYDHALTSQAFSNVYLASPTRGAIFAEDRFDYGSLVFVAGLRYDFFNSNGTRPWILNRNPSSATFGEYHQFPRFGSFGDRDEVVQIGGASLPVYELREDERHTAWSPTIRAAADLTEETRLRAGATRSARMPDLGLSLMGINTDLAITSLAHSFGTDLGFERAWTFEVGATQKFGGGLTGEITGFHRSADGVPVEHFVSAPDPQHAYADVDLVLIDDVGRETARGIDTRLAWTAEALWATMGYSWQDIDRETDLLLVQPPAPWQRPHNVTAAIGYTAPEGVQSGLFQNASFWLAFRLTTGAPYQACAGAIFSDEPCAVFPDPASELRLPSFRQLDLRFSRRLGGPSGSVTAYVDARNLLGRRNLVRAWSATGTTSNPAAFDNARDAALQSYQLEAQQNGVLVGGDVDLTFAGMGSGGCGDWVSANGSPAAPNCIALVRAEQRWGDGDGVFSPDEQATAADAAFAAFTANGFYAAPRRIRLGLEVAF